MHRQGQARRRGFLLMVVVGVLAILLAICVGFLSFARSEVTAVQTMRNKNDVHDITQSAVDWTLANIGNYLFNGGTSFDDSKYVAFTQGNGGQWWYRPYEKDLKDKFTDWNWATIQVYAYKWANSHAADIGQPRPNCVSAGGRDQAEWIYLPESFFPEGGVRGRYMVQVLDPNCMPNLNDWLTDCCPTQTQMAHMIRDGYGEQQLERYRRYRDTGNGWTTQPKFAPIRFHEAWRVATNSYRQPQWVGDYQHTGERLARAISPNWVTSNSVYMSGFGAEMILRAGIVGDGIYTNKLEVDNSNPFAGVRHYNPPSYNEGRPGPDFSSTPRWEDSPSGWSQPGQNSAYGWSDDNKWSAGQIPGGVPFSIYAYEDPDTGRSPLNINTCYNSGERLPMNVFGGTPTFAVEAVFNVDSLRRLIWVGTFWDGTDWVDLRPTSTTVKKTWADLTDDDKNYVENLKTKLAYWYQETMCRYLTGTYRHSMQRKYPPLITPSGAVDITQSGSYSDGDYSAAGSLGPVSSLSSGNYTGIRFSGSPSALHNTIRTALQNMSTLPGPSAPVVAPATPQKGVYDDYDATLHATGDVYVHFDKEGDPDVPPGYIDEWTANAIFDNVVPGKPTTWPQSGAMNPSSGDDPLTTMWKMRLAREEYTEDTNHESHASKSVYGYHHDAASLYDSGNHGPTHNSISWNSKGVGQRLDGDARSLGFGMANGHFWKGLNLRPKGADIRADNGIVGPPGPWDDAGAYKQGDAGHSGSFSAAVGQIPYRQWTFGPDWFSTELTTTTTSFIFIVNAQLVDAKSVAENPNKPVVIYHSQTGIAVELCPDVERNGSSSGGSWPSGSGLDGTSVSLTDSGVGYYRGGNPRKRKSDGRVNPGQNLDAGAYHSMDFKCGTLRTTYIGCREVPSRSAPWQNTSIPKEWKADFRGVRPADESSFYGSRTTTRRIQVRGYWTMDTIISR